MLFERTICMCKEKMSNGRYKITRIPWDLISVEGEPFMISPMPIAEKFDERVQTGTYTPDLVDMLNDPDFQEVIDPVVKIEFFESEADFTSKFDNVNAFYTSDSDQSREFGYPRT